MAENGVGTASERRPRGLWLRLAAAVWVALAGAWFAAITWPESGGVYVWLAAPLVLCVLSVAAARRNGSRGKGWLCVAVLAVVTVLSLASFGMFLIPALLALVVAQFLPSGDSP